jgi:hypothetical protein
MAFLAQVLAYLLQWILTLGGRALYEWTNRYVDKQKEKKKEQEAHKKYQDEVKKGVKSDEMLERETDILNGN